MLYIVFFSVVSLQSRGYAETAARLVLDLAEPPRSPEHLMRLEQHLYNQFKASAEADDDTSVIKVTVTGWPHQVPNDLPEPIIPKDFNLEAMTESIFKVPAWSEIEVKYDSDN
jgi:hypothetical protein